MGSANYMMITVASVGVSDRGAVLKLVDGLANDLREGASAVSTRYGVIITGDFTGKLVLFQGYEDLNGIDRAFGVYQESDNYRAILATPSFEVVMRNLWKLEPIGLSTPQTTVPAYGVVTRFGSADPLVETMKEILPIIEANGASVFRYGTLTMGNAAGRRLTGIGYPSMDAIERTYKALGESEVYRDGMAKIDLDWRNMIGFEG